MIYVKLTIILIKIISKQSFCESTKIQRSYWDFLDLLEKVFHIALGKVVKVHHVRKMTELVLELL